MRPVGEQDLELLAHHRNHPETWRNLTQSLPVWVHNQKNWLNGLGKSDIYFINQFTNTLDNKQPFRVSEVGLIRITDIDWQNRNAAIGVDTFEGYRGKGYGSKFFNMAVEYCFDELNLHRLWLNVLDDNLIAKGIYLKAGFKSEGTLVEHIYRNGKWHNYVAMAILRDDYRRTKKS
jgi:RimJ/RimL family protein N-acetyltransferase